MYMKVLVCLYVLQRFYVLERFVTFANVMCSLNPVRSRYVAGFYVPGESEGYGVNLCFRYYGYFMFLV